MSEKPTFSMIEYVSSMNSVLGALHEQGRPFVLPVHGRPQLQVDSVDPLVYREYGQFFNRAPNIAGSFAVVKFMIQTIEVNNEETDLMRAYGVIEASSDMHYGVLAPLEVVVAAARHISRVGREYGIIPEPHE